MYQHVDVFALLVLVNGLSCGFGLGLGLGMDNTMTMTTTQTGCHDSKP